MARGCTKFWIGRRKFYFEQNETSYPAGDSHVYASPEAGSLLEKEEVTTIGKNGVPVFLP